jgi:RNA polymerase sigma-70 factor (ECF subfamily)
MGAFATTSADLLVRVRRLDDGEAWQTFFDLYAPLLYRHARTLGLSAADAAEVRDQCLLELTRTLPRWRYDRGRGRFKGYLHTLVRAKAVDAHRRRLRAANAVEDPLLAAAGAADDPAQVWERQWHLEHLRYCCEQARRLVSARTYGAFELLAVHGASVAEVCARLGLSENQVYKARSRVLAEVRRLMAKHGEETG